MHTATREPAIRLPAMRMGEQVVEDYATLRMSLRCHPLALLRPELEARGVVPCTRLGDLTLERPVTVAGLVLARQRPGTASGVIFITLEDETGIANIIVWPKLFERYRRETLGARLLCVSGELQREGLLIHVIAHHLRDMTGRLLDLAGQAPLPAAVTGATTDARSAYPSRDFR